MELNKDMLQRDRLKIFCTQVVVSLKARVPSSSGEQGRGIPYFSTVSPLVWAMGSGRVGKYLEEGLGSMAKAEKAILSCPIEAGKPKDQLLPPAPDGIDRVEFEVELHSMIQVLFPNAENLKQCDFRLLREALGIYSEIVLDSHA